MSELIHNSDERLKTLFNFTRRLIEGENGKMLIGTYKHVIETVNASEAMQVFDQLLIEGYPVEKVKACLIIQNWSHTFIASKLSGQLNSNSFK